MIKFNNNDYNNRVSSFGGKRKDITAMTGKENILKERASKCNKMLANLSERSVPENNKFQPVSVDYNLPDSQNMAKVTVECDYENPANQRRVSVGVHHKDRDRLISNYLFKGTKQEVINFLKDEKNQQQFVDSIKTLSAKTDEYYDKL